jgi:hypothetical protein
MHVVSVGVLIAVGLGTVLSQAACDNKHGKDKVASLSSTAPKTSAGTASTDNRPRHRVDETRADYDRIIQPWEKCMKDNGADTSQMPPSITGAAQWSKDHARAGDTCRQLMPLMPWGLDKANPQYRDNVHQWVKCMTDKGLSVVETPDDEDSPWRYTSNSTMSGDARAKIEDDCEKATVGKSDK